MGTRRGVAYRNLGVEASGDPLPDWVFTQGVELVLDAEERVLTAEALAVAVLTNSEIVVSTDSPLLRDGASDLGIEYRVID